jgi:hypothetical protein
MRKIIALGLIFISLLSTPSLAAADYIKAYIPEAKAVGQGRLSVFMFDVYDATLYTSDGKWQEGQPLALELQYLREIEGYKIADRSAEEMRNQGLEDEVEIAAWHAQMRKIFPDVQEGITLTGVLTAENHTVFIKNGQEIGRIKDPNFGRAFFNIWLNEKTSAPKLRKKLLGLT